MSAMTRVAIIRSPSASKAASTPAQRTTVPSGTPRAPTASRPTPSSFRSAAIRRSSRLSRPGRITLISRYGPTAWMDGPQPGICPSSVVRTRRSPWLSKSRGRHFARGPLAAKAWLNAANRIANSSLPVSSTGTSWLSNIDSLVRISSPLRNTSASVARPSKRSTAEPAGSASRQWYQKSASWSGSGWAASKRPAAAKAAAAVPGTMAVTARAAASAAGESMAPGSQRVSCQPSLSRRTSASR